MFRRAVPMMGIETASLCRQIFSPITNRSMEHYEARLEIPPCLLDKQNAVLDAIFYYYYLWELTRGTSHSMVVRNDELHHVSSKAALQNVTLYQHLRLLSIVCVNQKRCHPFQIRALSSFDQT